MEIREAGPAISILPGLHRDKLFRSERLRRVRLHSFHLSAALPTREATIWEWKSGKPARQYLSCPAFIETNFSDSNKECRSRTVARTGHWSAPGRPDED